MATAVMVKHTDIEDGAGCDGPLIQTLMGTMKCGNCDRIVGRVALQRAEETLPAGMFYGQALALVDRSDEE